MAETRVRMDQAIAALRTIEGQGLADYRATYEAHRESIGRQVVQEIGMKPGVGPLIEAISRFSGFGVRPSGQGPGRTAVEGPQPEAYVLGLAALGKALTGMGVAFEIWLEFMLAFQQRLTVCLVQAHSQDPGRLSAALVAAVAHYQVGINVIGAQFAESNLVCERQTIASSFFDHCLDAMLLTEPDGTIVAANPAACRMFGHTEDGLKKVGRAGVVDRTDPRLPAALEARKLTGRFEGELNMVRADGQVFPAEVSTGQFPDGDGRQRTAMIIRDVADKRAREMALQESELRYRYLVETAQEGIVMIDPAGVISFANARMADLVGLPLGNLPGTSFFDFVELDVADAMRRTLRDCA